jgi:two-component system sensor histidine kinase HydH
MLLLVWVPIVAIGSLHYGTHTELAWVHNVLRRLYYLPIIFAAFHLGLRGGLMASVAVCVTYLPHAFLHLGHMLHSDPADAWDKGLEMVLYNVVGAVAGYLADQERRRRIQLQAALDEQQRLQHQLVRAGRLSALGEVVAGIAHEIKNPLHSLKGTAEVVDPLIPEDAEERRMWSIHVSELDRLGRVADRFVSFSNPKPPELRPLDLRDVAQRLAQLSEADARKRGVRLETHVPPEPIMVRGDRDQLAQVGLNVVVNAVRAIGDGGGRVVVTVTAGDDPRTNLHRLTIENDGPPIPEAELEHLFDPFHSGSPDGTGLGLSISARIMDQHGGTLEAVNAGLGVRFSLGIPRAE